MADITTSPEDNKLEKLKSYIRTQKGTILAAEILISFIVLVCYAASYTGGFSVLALFEMTFATIFFVIYMLELDKRFRVVHWIWSDFFRATVGSVLYLVTSLFGVIGGHGDGARIAGGVFGLIAGLLFLYDAYTIYLLLKSTQQNTGQTTGDRV